MNLSGYLLPYLLSMGQTQTVRVDLRALSSLRGLRGAPKVPPLCRETQSLGQHMLELSCENATVGGTYCTTLLISTRVKIKKMIPKLDIYLNFTYSPISGYTPAYTLVFIIICYNHDGFYYKNQ